MEKHYKKYKIDYCLQTRDLRRIRVRDPDPPKLDTRPTSQGIAVYTPKASPLLKKLARLIRHRADQKGFLRGYNLSIKSARSIFKYVTHFQGTTNTGIHISPKAIAATTVLCLLPTAEGARPHITSVGIPVASTFAGALGWVISCLRDDKTVSGLLCWNIYAWWGLSALLAVMFTAWSIVPGQRSRYVGVFFLMEILVFVTLLASSISYGEGMAAHIAAWMPMVTVLVAGGLPMAFDRVQHILPEHTGGE